MGEIPLRFATQNLTRARMVPAIERWPGAEAYKIAAGVVFSQIMPPQGHHGGERQGLRLGVITASDSRTVETDSSGDLIKQLATAAGHHVEYYEILPDDAERIRAAIVRRLPALDAIVVNGGTGVAARDSTIEAIRPLLEKELEGFGELFRMLSYQEIGSAALLSRALAGVRRGRIIVALPGSTAACRLGMEKLLLPEIGHLAWLVGT